MQETDVPLEKVNARKLSFTWKMDSSEEKELFLLGFILVDDKWKKKKPKKRRFWVREIFLQRERQAVFSNLPCELQLGDREDYFKYLFKNIFFQVFLTRYLKWGFLISIYSICHEGIILTYYSYNLLQNIFGIY